MAIGENLTQVAARTVCEIRAEASGRESEMEKLRVKATAIITVLSVPEFAKFLYKRCNLHATNFVDILVCSSPPDDMPRTIYEKVGLYLRIGRDGEVCFHEALTVDSLWHACGCVQLPVGNGNINKLIESMYGGRYTSVKHYSTTTYEEPDQRIVCSNDFFDLETLLRYFGSQLGTIEEKIIEAVGYQTAESATEGA